MALEKVTYALSLKLGSLHRIPSDVAAIQMLGKQLTFTMVVVSCGHRIL